ncbi:MAG: adenylyl-sulfate kinase [Gammaproteobacteria bacterium]|nr:adenylyl-sulfate kinase [Gammaproteobacteria bacterium]
MSDLTRTEWPRLAPRYLDAEAADRARETARDCPSWDLTPRQLCDLELLLSGALTPLNGYLGREAHDRVVATGTLPDGMPFPWPLSLDVDETFAAGLSAGDPVALRDPEGLLVAMLQVSDVWAADTDADAATLFPGPEGEAGRDWLADGRQWRLGGRVEGVDPPCHYDFAALRASPEEIQQRITRMGWRRVLAVLTRRPIGPGEHALISRRARELEANVLILAEGGMPEAGDVRYYARLQGLEAVMPRFAEQTTELALVPLAPPLGSPREAGLRHLLARNHGATHVLLLDDDPSDAMDLSALDHALGIEAVAGGRPVYLADRDRFAVDGADVAGEDARAADSDALLARLRNDDRIPDWLQWPELTRPLRRAWPPRSSQGFTLFLTGLSGSGKSTIARALLGRLMEEGSRRVTLLDGDIVRKNLSSELGFSREHRDLNILRIGFVASEITKNGGVAICAPIAPYAATRRSVRGTVEAVGGFLEVHVATPLEVCEDRDRKGLYAKARAGLIKEFTGISDPYETPTQPELRIDTTGQTPDEAAQQILLKLAALGYL